jgi:DNA-binding PadR family transcriptional regulator
VGVTRASTIPELSLTEWAVLALVAEGRTHGFAAGREFAREGEIGGVWTIPRPLVYRAIGTLTARGLLREVGFAPGSGGPRRREIEAAAAGVAAVRAWLVEPVAHVRDARSEPLLKLLFVDRGGGDTLPLLRAQRVQLAELLAALRERRAASEGFAATLAHWRVCSAEAAVRFVADLIEERERRV